MARRLAGVRYPVAVGLALALLLLGALLPLWRMTLHAPQYPKGLRLIIDGRGVHGDVDELNALNHYIGMPPIRIEEIPEARLFFPGVAALALGVLLSLVVPWRVFRALAVLGAWALPLVFLGDLQWRLHQFGHSLDPAAAFRLPAFTPLVIGPTVVMNFNVTASPGMGLILLILSALVLTLAPAPGPGGRLSRRPVPALGLAALALVAVGLGWASPAWAGPSAPAGAHAVAAWPGGLAAAVAAAPAGAILEIRGGYHAGPLVISRPVVLRGVDQPVIDAGGRGDVVVIAADDVVLEGFVIRGSALAYSREAAGVVVRGARATVRGNRIEDVLFGVYLAGAVDAVVEGNTIATADLPLERRGHALYLWRAQRTHLVDNRILRGKDGIYISYSDGNLVQGNRVSGSRYGIHYMYSHRNTFRGNVFHGNVVGAAVMYSSDVTLVGNTFDGSRDRAAGAGLIFKDADRLLVADNRIVRNRIGVELDGTPASIGGWARLERNLIAFNEVGLSLMSTTAITATGNAFVENLRQVHSRGALRAEANRWTVDGRGNHWGDYAGFDADGDGIGDIPYRRTDLLEHLADRSAALQAFLYTPAHLALEAAARLMPLVRSAPIVEDAAPLMRPPVVPSAMPPADDAPAAGLGLLGIGAALLVPSAAALVAAGRRRRLT